MRVVDACALIEVLLGGPLGDRVDAELAGQLWAAPELVHVEVVSTLARHVRADELTRSDADSALRNFLRMPIKLVRHRLLTRRAWDLRDRIRVTDGFYVACAERLDCAVVTTDGRLSRAPLAGVSIIYVQ